MNSPEKSASAQGKKEMKLAVVGSGGVGKTAITVRFVTSHFYDSGYNPTIEDSYRKQVVVNGEAVTLEILDTAGQEEYAVMADQWYRYAEGFLLVYSITDRQSFMNLNKMHKDILRVKEKGKKEVACIVVSQKCDLAPEREVGQLEGRDLAKELHAPFIECSAAEGVNVDAAFRELVKLVRRKKARQDKVHMTDTKRVNLAADRVLAGPFTGGDMHNHHKDRSASTNPSTAPSTAGAYGTPVYGRSVAAPDAGYDGVPVGLRTPDLPRSGGAESGSQRGLNKMGDMERQQQTRPTGPGNGQGLGYGMGQGTRGDGDGGAYTEGAREKGEQVKGGCCVIM